MFGRHVFVVRSTVRLENEQAFNHWYNTEHLHRVSQLPGCIGARRYRALSDAEDYPYLAVYDFNSKESLEAALISEYFQQMIREFDAAFGSVTKRTRSTYMQIFP
jgi:hypothetical protein